MEKKFLVQLTVLFIVIIGGFLTVFSPASLGLPSIIPGGNSNQAFLMDSDKIIRSFVNRMLVINTVLLLLAVAAVILIFICYRF